MPTLLELVGVPLLDSYEGQSLLPLLNADPEGAASFRTAIAEYHNPRNGWILSIRSDRWRYIYNPREITPRCRPRNPHFRVAVEELYDHDTDSQELHNVVKQHPRVAASLRQKILAVMGGRKPPGPAPRAAPEILQQLRELGYVID